MSELLVTQCPHCQTRFRLTPAQLSVANGHVRCGACLEVFHAADAALALAEQPVPAQPPEQHTGNTVAEDEQPVSPPPAPQPSGSLLEDDLDDHDEPDLAALGLDESIISEVNPDGPTPQPQPQPQPVEDDRSTSLTDLHEDFLATPPAQDFGPEFDHNRAGLHRRRPDDEGYSDKGIFQRDYPDAVTAAPRPETAEDTPEQTQNLPETQAVPTPQPVPAPEQPTDETGKATPLNNEDGERVDPPLTSLQVEMLEEELLFEATPRRRPPSWLWNSLALLALLGLPAQYLVYNFDALARDQNNRPWLENLCMLARCELPARVDISRIRSTNLLVRPHPEFPNALAIDVIIYNRADFEQPFPVLEMQFTDGTGRPLASRRFRPEEYLSGELAGVRLMPSQTPIRVGLSMLDPGAQARNYSLEFLSP